MALLKVEINGHNEQINTVVIDLNRMYILLGHDWLAKHNLEVNWKKCKIWFTRCPKLCKIKIKTSGLKLEEHRQ